MTWNRQLADDKIPFGSHVDALFPSLYTFYNNQNGWFNYAKGMLEGAKTYGIPVYAYIWPKYHDSTPLKDTYIDANFWRMELETAYQYADGIVIWNYDPKQLWDENAPWWKATLAFMKEKKLPVTPAN